MIEARGLTKRYGEKTAVQDLSFQVRPGMVTGFLGPNGSGKSTTMRMILGLDAPSSGTATVCGRRYRDLDNPMRTVGALIDAKALHGGRSAYRHLLALAQLGGIPRRRVDEVLSVVGLQEAARKRSKGFSLGMGQRLGIAAALLGDPQVLLFDEPVNGLDPEGILWIRNLMKSLAAEGRTVLVSSHLMSEMALTAEHLVIIGRGRLLADVSMRSFIQQYSADHLRVRTEPEGTELLARVLTEAGGGVQPEQDGALRVTGLEAGRISDLTHGNGLRILELTPQQASLEEAYMQMTQHAVEYRAGGAPTVPPPQQQPPQQQPPQPQPAGGFGYAPQQPRSQQHRPQPQPSPTAWPSPPPQPGAAPNGPTGPGGWGPPPAGAAPQAPPAGWPAHAQSARTGEEYR